jgi:hypothetical protein
MNRSTPGHLLHYVTRRLRLRRYLQDPGDGRQQPQIPAQALLWALLIGQILRQSSFHAVEALVRSSARRTLRIATPFCDDTLGYFTERLPTQRGKPCSLSSAAPSATRPSTIAAGSVWPSTAPVRDGGPSRAVRSAAQGGIRRNKFRAINILS